MIGGIYTSDAENLSLKATFPRFLEMEKTHGSIIKALRAQKKQAAETSRDTSGPRYSLFLSFKTGMQTLIDALVETLSSCNIKLNTRVEHIQQDTDSDEWQISLATGETLNAEHLCLALPCTTDEIARPNRFRIRSPRNSARFRTHRLLRSISRSAIRMLHTR